MLRPNPMYAKPVDVCTGCGGDANRFSSPITRLCRPCYTIWKGE
jgi:hypothetical protein